ncbi:MAG: hypothetical protein Q7R98_02700 [Candidatus Jorgensenbacteria bacterium]|nr:hypothetical protein [Candidatus Jorgensenbacteria bacterium]
MSKKQYRPFHEVALSKIKAGLSITDMEFLMSLISDTKIPKGQSEIIEALEEYFKDYESEEWKKEVTKISANLLKQKEIAEAEVAEKRVTKENVSEQTSKDQSDRIQKMCDRVKVMIRLTETFKAGLTQRNEELNLILEEVKKMEIPEVVTQEEKEALEADTRMIEKGY